MDLIQELIKATGVTPQQAEGGAGALFKMAQDKLGAGDFSKLTSAIPQIQELIKAAPSSGGGGLLGSIAQSLGGSQLGGLASMAGMLTSLKLDPATIGKFVPVIIQFVQQQGSPELAAMLQKILPKA
jgi:hypothetical protein